VKLRVFHASDGDCLLVSSRNSPPRHLLVDGGRATSYEQHVRGVIGALREAGETLNIVCVSHIDDDHISGILRLVEDEVEWRQFEFRQAQDASARPPRIMRPPKIGQVWHNGLFRLVGDELAPQVEIVLSSVATVLAGSRDAKLKDVASQLDDLATGERSSMELSRRISPEQLKIPLNKPSAGALLKRGDGSESSPPDRFKLGRLRIALLGPSDDDIAKLRVSWQTWIDRNQAALAALQKQMLEDEANLGTLSPRIVANPMLDQALGQGLSQVTEANLASLMLLVEEGRKSVLLPGDGVSSEILEGLAHHGKLDSEGRIHLSVLKVQHHGALANVETEFVRRVTADHYVFSGNGAHSNPEIEVVEAFAQARLTGIDGGDPVGPSRPFKFWFTSSSSTPDTTQGQSRRQHMEQVEQAVTTLRQGHEAVMEEPTFLTAGSFEIVL
jgi:beta-lactamase superfamily II metal-dependent hydrolase